jgi:catechol 2,3-dioxygenase-like lactoylglutathione lyase family enzyme
MAMERIISKLVDEFEQGRLNRRELIQGLTIAAASAIPAVPAIGAAPAMPVVKATAVNHISYQVADYARSRDFYAGLLGMRVQNDNGKECELAFGDTCLIVRAKGRGMEPLPGQNDVTPRIDHMSYTVADWDARKPALKAELERRGMKYFEAIRQHAPITRGHGDSFMVRDPDGYPFQIGGEEQ